MMRPSVPVVIFVMLFCTTAAGQDADLRDIRVGTHDDYTRIVFELSAASKPVVNNLKAEKLIEVVFGNIAITYSRRILNVDDSVVQLVRVTDTGREIRAVIQVTAERYSLRTNYLTEPDRVVIDVHKSGESQLAATERILQTGIELYDRKEYDKAIVQFRQAIKNRPGYTDAYFYAALIRKERGQNDMAKFNFRRALGEEEKWSDAHFHLAVIHLIEKDTAEAIKEFSRYVAVGKDEAKVIEAESRLSILTGLPSIESPAQQPAGAGEDFMNGQRKWIYIFVGVLLIFTIIISWYIFSTGKGKISHNEETAVGDEEIVEDNPAEKVSADVGDEIEEDSPAEEVSADVGDEIEEDSPAEEVSADVGEEIEEDSPAEEISGEAAEEETPEISQDEEDEFSNRPVDDMVDDEPSEREAEGIAEDSAEPDAAEESTEPEPDEAEEPVESPEEISESDVEDDTEAAKDAAQPESSNRWLRTDHETMSEVDSLSDKFQDLSDREKELEQKISDVVKRLKENED